MVTQMKEKRVNPRDSEIFYDARKAYPNDFRNRYFLHDFAVELRFNKKTDWKGSSVED